MTIRKLLSRASILAAMLGFMSAVQAGVEERTETLQLPSHAPVLLKFKAFDPSRVLVDEKDVLKRVTETLQKQSKWPLKVKPGIIVERSGLQARVDETQSQIGFEYVNMEHYDGGSKFGQKLTILVSYELSRTDRDFSIRLIPPAAAELYTRSSRGFLRVPTPMLDSPVELTQDFSTILDAASGLVVDRQCIAEGEKTSKYKPEAIIGNFERLLGLHAGNSEAQASGLENTEVFSYLAGQSRVPLSITAIAYRDGAKIRYKAALPYTLRADGTGEGYDLPEKLSTDIDRILAD